MEGDMNPPASTVCRGGCGFFGSPATEGLCSKCFKDTLKRKQDTQRLSPTSMTATGASTSGAAAAVAEKIREAVQAAAEEHTTNAVQSGSTGGLAIEDTKKQEKQTGDDDGGSDDGKKSVAETLASPSSSLVDESTAPSFSSNQQQQPTKKPNRCHRCNKKVGLTGFPCRCGGVYCGEHRYFDAHSCSFDYKTMERENLRKNNPVIVSEKIQRI